MNTLQNERLTQILPKLADVAMELENIGLKHAASMVYALEIELRQMDGVEIIRGKPQ